jgi:class 3 adenylate cyclase
VGSSSLVVSGADLTVGDLLRAHPWPKEYAGDKRLEWLWTIDVDLAPAELWPLLSDVSRMNRAMGNPEMDFWEREGIRWGRARYGGIMHEWREVPWDWVAGRWFTLVRVYTKGAMRTFYSLHRLESLGAKRTRVYIYFGVVPRWSVLVPIMKLNFGKIGRAYRRLLPQLAAEHRDRMPPVFEMPPPQLEAEAKHRLAEIERGLKATGLDAPSVERLVAYVRGGDELDLCRIQVRERARTWGVDEDALLRVFLHATRAGLLELAWDVVCPHCRGVRASQDKLSDVPTEASCEVCAVTFGTENGVEITFRVHSSIRRVEERLFCSAEPATKTHIRVQRALAPGEDAAFEIDLDPGRYRLRNRGNDEIAGWLDVTPERGGEPEIPWRASQPPGELASAQRAALTLINDSSEEKTFILETAQPADLALRPGRLLSHQEFRDLFSKEFLGADVRLAVGQQTILFTDIVGSTAMYAARGDAAAFSVVKRHFTEVFAIIARHRGALVKTIGDAAMGAFTDPVDALRAAEAIQRVFVEPGGVRLRISVNTDACIAVKLNANIDYFGQAVNLAAKLQGSAASGQIAVSSSTLNAPGVAAFIAPHRPNIERVETTVKGLRDVVITHVWTVHTA